MTTQYAHKTTKGNIYYLHSTKMAKPRGGVDRFYFFAKEPKSEHTAEPVVPDGYEVGDSKRGLPILRKIKPTRVFNPFAERAEAEQQAADDADPDGEEVDPTVWGEFYDDDRDFGGSAEPSTTEAARPGHIYQMHNRTRTGDSLL